MKNFSQKDLLADNAKIIVVKIIFHVLFLVLETRERRKWNKLQNYAVHKFIFFGGLVGLFNDRGPKNQFRGTKFESL